MAHTKRIELAFTPFWKRRKPTGFLDGSDPVAPAGQDLVGVNLVSDIPDQPVMGCFKAIIQGDRQLNTTQACTEVSAAGRYCLDQVLA